ncbi:hypothetical protein V7112_05200, partial [Bacillus sp. JJ1566]|uniref:hypothetical protein n=1 Tax=Bacillus sp. JJ1566 TaxID=3122961 RepID=UPI002FFD97AD
SFLSSIYKDYKNTTDIEEEFHYESNIRNHLVSIGGPVHNPLTHKLLELINSPITFDNISHEIVDKNTGTQYIAEVRDEFIIKDYGLIIRTNNPFNKERTVTILAGSRTYGTLSSAEALTMPFLKTLLRELGDSKNFALLLHVYPPGKPEIIKFYNLDKQ